MSANLLKNALRMMVSGALWAASVRIPLGFFYHDRSSVGASMMEAGLMLLPPLFFIWGIVIWLLLCRNVGFKKAKAMNMRMLTINLIAGFILDYLGQTVSSQQIGWEQVRPV